MLTRRQSEMLAILEAWDSPHPPKLYTLAARLGASSKTSVSQLLRCLEERGYIRVSRGGAGLNIVVIRPRVAVLIWDEATKVLRPL